MERIVIDVTSADIQIVECSKNIVVVIQKKNEDLIFDRVDKSSYLPIKLSN